jgi:hypothetical protein
VTSDIFDGLFTLGFAMAMFGFGFGVGYLVWRFV